MNNGDCVKFLQWCLPKLSYRWKGFRKVRNQVCKRVKHRIKELNLSSFQLYRTYLDSNANEWEILDSMCTITISRFYRDRGVMESLYTDILPQLAERAIERKEKAILCWSAGCCSGEEPYTLKILWDFRVLPKLASKMPFRIIATEKRGSLLERAERGIYQKSSFRELPEDLIPQVFDKMDEDYKLKDCFKLGVEFVKQNIRQRLPEGEFDLVLCRNLIFTYFQEELQTYILEKIIGKLNPYGFLVIGAHEVLPQGDRGLFSYKESDSIYQKGLSHSQL